MTKINPIHGRDLSMAICKVIDDPVLWSDKDWEIGGPDIYTIQEICNLAFEISERETMTTIPLPTWLSSLSSLVLPFNLIFGAMLVAGATLNMDFVGERFGSEHLADHMTRWHFGDIDDSGEWTNLIVHAGGKCSIPFTVTPKRWKAVAPKSMYFDWQFSTESLDIAFFVLFRSLHHDSKIVLTPRQVWEAHRFTISGSVEIPGPGTLFAVFDNRYSVFRKKVVKYRLQIREDCKEERE